MSELVRGGQYSIQLAQQKLSNEIQGFSTGSSGVVGTTVRTSIDSAVQAGIASQKVTGETNANFSSLNRLRTAVTNALNNNDGIT